MQVAMPVDPLKLQLNNQGTNHDVGASVSALKKLLSIPPSTTTSTSNVADEGPTKIGNKKRNGSSSTSPSTGKGKNQPGSTSSSSSSSIKATPIPVVAKNGGGSNGDSKNPYGRSSPTGMDSPSFNSPNGSSSESEMYQKSSNAANASTRKKPKNKTVASPYFAASSFQNSPDPNSIPMPDFDDLPPVSHTEIYNNMLPPPSSASTNASTTMSLSSSPTSNKTDSLRKLLNLSASNSLLTPQKI